MIPVQDNKANLYVCLSQFKTIGFFMLLLVFGKKGFFWCISKINVYNLQQQKTMNLYSIRYSNCANKKNLP